VREELPMPRYHRGAPKAQLLLHQIRAAGELSRERALDQAFFA
jgi:hypothetical protein